jgi:hypothetical protein
MRSISAAPSLTKGRPHVRAGQAAEQHQRLLHAVMHVDEGIGIEGARERVDAVVDGAGRREVVLLDGAEQRRLQIGDDAAATGQQALAAEHQRAHQPGRMGGEHVYRPRQALQGAHLPLMELHVVGPVLDGADLRHRLDELEERLRRIALPGRQRILEGDDRQVRRGIGDAPEMGDRHLGILPEGERARRKHQQRRRSLRLCRLGDACSLQTPIGPDAVHDRQPIAHLFGSDLHDPALLVEGAGCDLGRMRIHGDGRKAFRSGDVAQMGAEALLVDGEVVIERQQQRRDDSSRNVGGMARHRAVSCAGAAAAPRLTRGSWPIHSPSPVPAKPSAPSGQGYEIVVADAM